MTSDSTIKHNSKTIYFRHSSTCFETASAAEILAASSIQENHQLVEINFISIHFENIMKKKIIRDEKYFSYTLQYIDDLSIFLRVNAQVYTSSTQNQPTWKTSHRKYSFNKKINKFLVFILVWISWKFSKTRFFMPNEKIICVWQEKKWQRFARLNKRKQIKWKWMIRVIRLKQQLLNMIAAAKKNEFMPLWMKEPPS